MTAAFIAICATSGLGLIYVIYVVVSERQDDAAFSRRLMETPPPLTPEQVRQAREEGRPDGRR